MPSSDVAVAETAPSCHATAPAASSGWLDVRSGAGTREFSDFAALPAALRRALSPAWLLLLCGDGSPTLSLSLTACGGGGSGGGMAVEVLGAELVGASDDGAPAAALAALPPPRLRRRVWLCAPGGGPRLGYAVSWWAAGGADAAALLGAGDADKPIGRAIAALETRRELHSVACTPAHAGLDAGLGVDRAAGRPPAGDLWSRFYTIFAGGRALCLVHEVFSPRLQTLGLGPQRRSPADAGAGGAGEEEEEEEGLG
jgi:chorismate--pyruvate lyase